MAQYLILIYQNESAADAGGEEQLRRNLAGFARLHEKHGPALRGGNALQRSATATAIRPDGAEGFTMTHGPFVQSAESLGGYYLIEAADLDEAITIAKDVPMVFGGVEVRPIRTFD